VKYAIKTALPIGKIGYSLFFVLLLCLARGISYAKEIQIALDAPMALLCAALSADVYFQEVTGERFETFCLLPCRRRRKTLYERMFATQLYATLLLFLGFVLYLIHRPSIYGGEALGSILVQLLLQCVPNCMFFGALAFFIVQLCQSLWMGLSLTLVFWVILNSPLMHYLPDACALFSYQAQSPKVQIIYKMMVVLCSLLLVIVAMHLKQRTFNRK
jgi:hypothetical protein